VHLVSLPLLLLGMSSEYGERFPRPCLPIRHYRSVVPLENISDNRGSSAPVDIGLAISWEEDSIEFDSLRARLVASSLIATLGRLWKRDNLVLTVNLEW